MLWIVQYWDETEWADYATFWAKDEARAVVHWLRGNGDTARVVVVMEVEEVNCG